MGQCNDDIASAIIQTLCDRTDQLNQHTSLYFGVGLALLYMGQQNKCEPAIEMLSLVDHEIKKFIEIMLISLAYIGSGNVLKVQNMMHECMSDEKHSETAILGLALIASSEEIGN